MKPYRRADRVADLIKRELAMLIQQKGSDPRYLGTTVTHVDVAPDLSNAKVFVTIIDADAAKQKEALDALNQASNFFRKYLFKIMRIKKIPKLIFKHDESIFRGSALSALIDQAVSADHKGDEDQVDE